MTPDQIKAWAREVWSAGGLYIGPSDAQLERFAYLVAAAERERCAVIVEKYTGAWSDQGFALAQAIREKND